MSRIKIIFVSQSARVAGAENALLTLVKFLDPERFEVVVAFSENGPVKSEMERLGVRTALCPLQWWIATPALPHPVARGMRTVINGLSTARRLPADISYSARSIRARVQAWRQFLEREKPDVVHTNTLAVWESALAARACGIAHIWHAHEVVRGNPAHQTVFATPLFFWIVAYFSRRVVVVSSWLKERMEGDVAPEKMAVIPNGVEVPPQVNSRESQREDLLHELGVPRDSLLVLTVATMTAEKGHMVLLQAAREVRSKNNRVHFVLAGHGAQATVKKFRDAIANWDLQSHFHYLGKREDVPRLMAAADLVVVPSLIETFSMVLVEAMAHGKPTVATRCGGPQTILSDGKTGVLVPVGDSTALATGVLRLANDEALRERLGKAALHTYLEMYRAQIFASRFSKLYEEIVCEETQPASPEDLELIENLMRLYGICESRALRRWRNLLATVVFPVKALMRELT